jgi:hypothetical protein
MHDHPLRVSGSAPSMTAGSPRVVRLDVFYQLAVVVPAKLDICIRGSVDVGSGSIPIDLYVSVILGNP